MSVGQAEREGRGPWVGGRRASTVALALLLSASITRAADMEVAPFLSYRVGGVEVPAALACPPLLEQCSERIETEDGLAWGLGFGLELAEDWWVDLRFSNQSVDFESEVVASTPEVSWDRYLVGLEHRWVGPSRWTPFVALAGGWTDLSVDLGFDSQSQGADQNHPTLELGGGLLLDRNERLGLRFEVRASWTRLPSELGADLVQVGLGLGFRLRSSS